MKGYWLFLIYLILLCNTTPLFSQKIYKEGYIIKNNGDSLSGWIEFEERNRPAQDVTFKRFEIAIPVVYTKENIWAYGYKNGNYFVLKKVDGKKLFIKCLVKGRINLYAYSKKLYIEKDGIEVTELSKGNITTYSQELKIEYNDYIELINNLTNDIEGFFLPSNVSLESEELVSIITDYNKQTKNPYWNYENQFDRTFLNEAKTLTITKRSNYGFITSIKFTNSVLNSAGDYLMRYPDLRKSNHNISIGGFYSYNISRMFNNIRLIIEGHVTHNSEKYYLKLTNNSPNQTFHIDVNQKDINLSVPISLQLSKSYNQITPYVSLGLTNEFSFRKEKSGLLEIETQDFVVFTNEINIQTPKSNVLQNVYPFFSLGIKYRLNNNLLLFVESRTNMGFSSSNQYVINGFYIPTVIVSNQTPLVFLFGIEF